MDKNWFYNDFEVKEGLKPGAKHFQYFFVVSEKGQKKCNYCVWITDDGLSGFAEGNDYPALAASHHEEWSGWVKNKIDARDFRNRVLKYGQSGKEEIDLSAMEKKLSLD